MPGGPKELGSYTLEGADTFTAKLHRGPYVFAVDLNLGFQVFRVQR